MGSRTPLASHLGKYNIPSCLGSSLSNQFLRNTRFTREKKKRRRHRRYKKGFQRSLDTESEFNAHVDFAGHLNNLGELNGFLRSILKVLDGKDLEARFVDLPGIHVSQSFP